MKRGTLLIACLFICALCGSCNSNSISSGGNHTVYGPIPNTNSMTLYGVYYGDWDDSLIQEVTGKSGKHAYKIIILHPHSNISPAQVKSLQNSGIKVFCYLSIGEDDTLHNQSASENISGPSPGYASWYYDADANKLPDQNAQWGSYYVNVSDPYWHKALQNYTNTGNQNWYGYDYDMNILGCDGLFLDTIDTVSPADWGGKYSAQLNDMVKLIAEIRNNIPADRFIIINRGLFYFDPYEAASNANGLHEITADMKDLIRENINGLMFENFMDESSKEDWAHKINTEAAKTDGFTIFSLDYLPIDIPSLCAATRGAYGWLPHVSNTSLNPFNHGVRDQCGY